MNLFDLTKIEYLRIIARRSGYTHKEIALMFGISEAYLSLWFAGKRNSNLIEKKLRELHDTLHPVEKRMIEFIRLGAHQSTIAKKLSISRQHLNQWLNGKRKSRRLDSAFEKLYKTTMAHRSHEHIAGA